MVLTFGSIICRLGDTWAWNNFDFWLVCVLYLPQGIIGGNVAYFRMLRLLRLLKLVNKKKHLNVIVSGLLKCLGSVIYILLMLIVCLYLFAVLGATTFRRNDPYHFGGVGMAMVTMFRVVTFDNWTNVSPDVSLWLLTFP